MNNLKSLVNEIWIHVTNCHHDKAVNILSSQLQRDKYNNGLYQVSKEEIGIMKLGYIAFIKSSDYEVWLVVPNLASKEDSNLMAQLLVNTYIANGVEANLVQGSQTGFSIPSDNPIWLMHYAMMEEEVKVFLDRRQNAPEEEQLLPLEKLIQKANRDNPEDHKMVVSFAGSLSRKLKRPPTAKEIESAWLNNKLMMMAGNPSDFNLDGIANYIAKSFEGKPNKALKEQIL